ncbi:hypothetical protein COLO4_30968 [Corchorus olitorius]|uniref:Uncharacterized protein n=1 Tax=Corchorus olitorius TaxID=93759 RepID=A0A1R3H692_9ROSI|nr:hypothetical protein COLO4_30968 [Corchorus olitorius]
MANARYPNAEEELGFKDYSPPFLDPNTTGDVILKGVNYACAGSGILNSTGYIIVKISSFFFVFVLYG